MSIPFDIPYSFVLDSAGNGVYTYQFANDYYYSANVSGTTSGTPTWSLLRQGIFLRPAVGPSVSMSSGVMAPGTQLTIKVTGGSPNATVTGLIEGAKSLSTSELSVPLAVPNSPGIVQVPQRFQLRVNANDPSFVYTIPYDGAVHTLTFPLPPGTLTARWWFLQLPGNPPAAWTQLHIRGNNTGSSYGGYTPDFDGQGGSTTGAVAEDATFRVWPADSALVVTGQFAANGTTAPAFQTMVEASLMQDVTVAVIGGEGQNASSRVGLSDIAPLFTTTSQTAVQAPWQFPKNPPARFANSVAANGTQILINGVNGKSLYVFGGTLMVDGNPGNIAVLQDNGLTNRLDFGSAPIPLFPMFYAPGAGLQVLNADTVAHVIRTSISYTQQ